MDGPLIISKMQDQAAGTLELFQALGISLLLGLLVGLQREVTHSVLAGFRTFPLITALGTVCGFLSFSFGGWILAVGLLGVVAVVVVGNLLILREEKPDPGITTEVAILLMFAVGALLMVEPMVGVSLGAMVAILLHLKPELHGIASRLERKDLKAIMQFALITFIVLPVLPNQTYGPLDVFNPFRTWLVVVLIVGIGLSGYLMYKFYGEKAGIVLGGILGGVISSTATTVSYSRLAHRSPEITGPVTVVLIVATTMMYFRILLEILVVAPSFFPVALFPITVMLLVSLLVSVLLWLRLRGDEVRMPEQKNPSELRAALGFGLLYTVVLMLAAGAEEYLGSGALYAVAGISGLADLDAITLSTAHMVESQRLDSGLAARVLVTAVMANYIFKAAVVALFGGTRLLQHILLPFGASLATGLALILVL